MSFTLRIQEARRFLESIVQELWHCNISVALGDISLQDHQKTPHHFQSGHDSAQFCSSACGAAGRLPLGQLYKRWASSVLALLTLERTVALSLSLKRRVLAFQAPFSNPSQETLPRTQEELPRTLSPCKSIGRTPSKHPDKNFLQETLGILPRTNLKSMLSHDPLVHAPSLIAIL